MPPRQKGRGRRKEDEHHEQHDVYHNGDIPCCRLLQDFSSQVLYYDDHQDSSSLASLLRQHLIQRQQQQLEQESKTTMNAKKKRKKKKRKKTAAATATTADETTALAPPEEEPAPQKTAEEEAKVIQQPQELSQSSSMRIDDKEAAASPDSSAALVKNFLNRHTWTSDLSETASTTDNSSSHSVQAFLETFGGSNSSLPEFQITQDQVRLATTAIQCMSCRRRTEDILEVESRVPLQSRQIPPKDDLAAVISSNDETAFDYVAMEEGNGIVYDSTTEESPAMYFQLVSSELTTAGWQLRQSDGEITLNMDNIDFLLNEYLILTCIHPDTLMGAHELSDNDMASLQARVDTRCTNLLNEFTCFAQDIQKNVEKLHSACRNSESNIDMKSFSIMQEVDEFLCDVMAQLLRILLEVTRAYQVVLAYATSNKGNASNVSWAHGRIMACWDVYFESMGAMFDAMSSYEQQLFDLADRQGVVPKMFVSSTARNLYYQSVSGKVQAVVKAVDQTQRILDQFETVDSYIGRDWTVRFLCKLLTYEAFYKLVAGTEKGNHRSQSAMDLACEDVLYVVREWIETVHQSSISKIMDVHHRRRDKLNRLLGTAGEHLAALIVTIQKEGRVDDVSHRDLSRQRQDVMALRERPAGDDEVETLRALRLDLVPAMFKMMQLWMGLSTYHSVNGASETVQPPVMPLKLTKGMAHQSVEDTGFCQGQAGSVRAACILVGLFFRWMSDRCKEWQAKLAEEELLMTMADAEKELQASAAKSSKANKKKRKKKPAVDRAKDSMGTQSTEEISKGSASFDSENQNDPDTEKKSPEDLPKSSPILDAGGLQPSGPSLLPGEPTADNVVENTPPTSAAGGSGTVKTKRPAFKSKEPLTEAKAETVVVSTETQGLESTHVTKKEATSESEIDSTAGSQAKLEKVGANVNIADDVEEVDPGTTAVQMLAKPKREDKTELQGKSLSRENASGKTTANNKKNKADNVEIPRKAGNGELRTPAESNLDRMVKVGVYDRSSFQSAEDFLVGRLVAVLNSSKKGKQNDVTFL